MKSSDGYVIKIDSIIQQSEAPLKSDCGEVPYWHHNDCDNNITFYKPTVSVHRHVLDYGQLEIEEMARETVYQQKDALVETTTPTLVKCEGIPDEVNGINVHLYVPEDEKNLQISLLRTINSSKIRVRNRRP